jgi:hypothetical protein
LNDKTRGGYVALDIKYDDDDEAPKKKNVKKTNSKSTTTKAKPKQASKLAKEV